MMSSSFRKSATDQARTALVTAATLLLTAATLILPAALRGGSGVGGASAVQAQTPPPPPTPDPPYKPFTVVPPSNAAILLSTEKQSPVNPFPFGGGNAQNRAWGADDYLWQLLDGNVPYYRAPLGRVSIANGLMDLDGWQFPRLTDVNDALGGSVPISDPNGLNRASIATATATAFADGEASALLAPAPVNDVGFRAITGAATLPSSNITSVDGAGNFGYYEGLAFPRPASSALNYDARNKFVWRLDSPPPATTDVPQRINIPGAAGTQGRYRLYVHIPTPTVPPTSTTYGSISAPENRVDDARYTVYYYIKAANGTFIPKQQVCTLVSQTDGGDFELLAADGTEPVFPLFSSATFTARGVPTGVTLPPQPTYPASALTTAAPGTPTAGGVPLLQGVAIDNTTADSGTLQFVVADSITLKPGTGTISATPTITPTHGGAKTVASSATAGAIPMQTKEYLPDSADAAYNDPTVAPHMPDPNNVFGDTASTTFSYANDVNDPLYSGANYANYTPWDVSTYFQGPRSLIDPRFVGTDANNQVFANPGAQIGPVNPYLSNRPALNSPANQANPVIGQDILRPAFSADATNNTVYPAPYFSHVQVLIAQTQFVQDPENSVSDADKTGVKTTQVGVIYGLDWHTGAPVWRFPDRTYLPDGATLNGVAIPGAGLRNKSVGMDPIAKVPVYTVPGIVAIDTNGDGKIADDEVFLGASQKVTLGGASYNLTAGANTTGEVSASVTVSPRVPVQGVVQIPVHDLTWTPTQITTAGGTPTDITSVTNATPGRYYNALPNNYSPVPVGTAFIAAGNGVVYAVDAYGNNDTRYFDGGLIPTTVGGAYVGGTYFGTYKAGTTNLFWTFAATSHSRQPTEPEGGIPGSPLDPSTTLLYDQRVMHEVPATASFGGSAPVLAWNLTDSEMAQNPPPTTPELRLFVGNTNGVLYAMDPQSNAGYVYTIDPMTGNPIPSGVQNLPFIKGAQPDLANYYGYNAPPAGTPATDPFSTHQGDLKWWFRTRGSIHFAPAVSPFRHDLSAYQSGIVQKGIYITSSEGRVYCIDWDGPSDLGTGTVDLGATAKTPYNGTPDRAAIFNNDSYFHNTLPAFNNGLADTREGHIRPRWTYPNLYRYNTAATVDNLTNGSVQADPAIVSPANSSDIGGIKLAEAQNLGSVNTPPVLMDFWWQDPDLNVVPTMLDYVAVVANDPTSNLAPATASRVYLLDQIGDPKNFLTNPRKSGTGNANDRVIALPRDRYTPNALLASQTDPSIPAGLTWSYRFQYDAYAVNNGTIQPQDANEIQLRNEPLFDVTATIYNQNINSYDPADLVTTITQQQIGQAGTGIALSAYTRQPGRRMLPTLFAGGVGKVYGLDIDPETGLFMRWRPTVAEMAKFVVLPSRMLQGLPLNSDPVYPGDPATTGTMSVLDQILPADHIFDGGGTGGTGATSPNQFGYARSDLATQEIFARVASFNSDGSAVTSLTVSGGAQNRNNRIQENAVAQGIPSVPARPTNDLPNLLPFAIATVVPPTSSGAYATVTRGDGSTAVTVDPNGLPSYPLVGSSLNLGGHVTGAVNQDHNDPAATTAGRIGSEPSTVPGANIPNAAMQYPILFVSTLGSYIHGLSTNIEGEDRQTAPPTGTGLDDPINLSIAGNSYSIAWGIAPPGDPGFSNTQGHVDLFDVQGPGGLAGIALFTNAYFPATDPYATAYRNTTSGTSLNEDPNNGQDEPNTTIPKPSGPGPLGAGTVTDPDNPGEPRPDFKPRPFVFAQAADAPNGFPQTLADAHTGMSGFPLSLNGHFFDRQYAGAGSAAGGSNGFPALTVITGNAANGTASGTFGYSPIANYNSDGQHPFGDYHIWPRVPGYSNIGTQLSHAATNLGLAYGDVNNQTPDGVRTVNELGVTGVDVRLPAHPSDATNQPGDVLSDDINPSGQDVAWFYTGGDNGVVYAYTPAIFGHDTGLRGGVRLVPSGGYIGGANGSTIGPNSPQALGADGTNPQVNIYSEADLNAILAQLTAGGGSLVNRGVTTGVASANTWQYQSIAARGGKNYYEWGETVYILSYDLLAKPFSPRQRRNSRFIPTIPVTTAGPQGGVDRSVQLTITSTLAGTTVNAPVLSLTGRNYMTDGTGRLLQYYLDNDGSYKVYDAASSPTSAIPLGVSVYKYVIGSNPSANNTQTPGDLLSIKVTQTAGGYTAAVPPQRIGATNAIQNRNSPAAYFAIANPLAIQASLSAVVGNTMVPVNPPVAGGDYINAVGPFDSKTDQLTAGSPKQADSTTVDPNKSDARYWQALTNGNTVRRVDTRAYISQGTGNSAVLVPNGNYGAAIRTNGQGVDPAFFFPVAGSAGYINHGTSGSTTKGTNNNAHYLRILNRSLLANGLSKVRVMPSDQPSDLLFRAWPAKVMNADADATVNTRITPLGMDAAGRINPLPWEAIPAEARPWSSATIVNRSLDYPDVQGRRNNALQVLSAGGDLTNAPGTLPAISVVSGTLPVVTGGDARNENDGVSVNVTMPKYQPANLVAAQELTSTYQVANPLDFPTGVTIPSAVPAGPLQLPRGVQNRLLTYNNSQVVTPFGYTARLVAFVDSDSTGRLSPNSASNRNSNGNLNTALKAYREFEVWTGVPVDQSLKVVESVIDLGALPHSFAEQNGLLGYNTGANNASAMGLTPVNPAYSGYFKPFTVQNTGNVNDYNLRPSQRYESPTFGDGTGSPFNYFLMRSATVDPNFGILAIGADPALPVLSPNPNGKVMPQIVTSLDPIFDTVWDAATKATLEAQLGVANGDALYTSIYQPFGGKHSFGKPKVGSATPSVLGIPDQPTAQQLINGVPLNSIPPAVAVAIPLGTPVGVYSSALGNSPFTIFEDHDTPNYAPVPVVAAGAGGATVSPTIRPAGPLYHGQNAAPPGALPVYSGGTSTTGQGIWRAQTASSGTPGTAGYVPPVFLPYAYPYLTIKAAVTENGLTGQFPDLAAAAVPSINTGVLPSIDALPIVTAATSTTTGATFYRPSAALTPAAWRDSATGTLHIYYSRNDSPASGAAPGAPYLLYHSTLPWDNGTGAWKAANPGTPLGVPSANGGHWLTTPVAVPSTAINGTGVLESNTSPFVLTHTPLNPNNTATPVTVDAATLFFTDSVASPNGSLRNRIFYTDVTSDGVGGAPTEYFTNADPSFGRYAPRAAFDEADGIDELMYYGGTAGKWSIYYVPRAATKGLPTGTAPDASNATTPVERLLTMPSAIVSASEPTPIYRSVYVTDPSTGTTNLTNVVDVYFTGISRTTQTPDIYMNRYAVGASGVLTPYILGANNVQIPLLPKVTKESMESIGRSGVWRSQSLSWLNATVPVITWAYNGGAVNTNGGADLVTVDANWRVDPSTGILYQAVQKNGSNAPTTLTYVYADLAAGTVQFRGAQAPQVKDSVTATYTPQTYRLTSDGASNFGNYSFVDPQVLAPTPTGQGSVIRRANALKSGRNYLLWQKGALASKSPTLYYAVRRVGVDLNIPSTASILLRKADATTGDQYPAVDSVTVGGNQIPFEVDLINGRVYIEPQWDGQPISVTYTPIDKGRQGVSGYTPTPTTVTGTAQYLDELNVGGTQRNFGAALPVTAGINEGQVAAMIDLFDWVGLGGSRADPPSTSVTGSYDPALQPGRVWVFWTSPRGRTGQTNLTSPTTPDRYPSGFNLYWETIAPNFQGSAIYSSSSTSARP